MPSLSDIITPEQAADDSGKKIADFNAALAKLTELTGTNPGQIRANLEMPDGSRAYLRILRKIRGDISFLLRRLGADEPLPAEDAAENTFLPVPDAQKARLISDSVFAFQESLSTALRLDDGIMSDLLYNPENGYLNNLIMLRQALRQILSTRPAQTGPRLSDRLKEARIKFNALLETIQLRDYREMNLHSAADFITFLRAQPIVTEFLESLNQALREDLTGEMRESNTVRQLHNYWISRNRIAVEFCKAELDAGMKKIALPLNGRAELDEKTVREEVWKQLEPIYRDFRTKDLETLREFFNDHFRSHYLEWKREYSKARVYKDLSGRKERFRVKKGSESPGFEGDTVILIPQERQDPFIQFLYDDEALFISGKSEVNTLPGEPHKGKGKVQESADESAEADSAEGAKKNKNHSKKRAPKNGRTVLVFIMRGGHPFFGRINETDLEPVPPDAKKHKLSFK